MYVDHFATRNGILKSVEQRHSAIDAARLDAVPLPRNGDLVAQSQ